MADSLNDGYFRLPVNHLQITGMAANSVRTSIASTATLLAMNNVEIAGFGIFGGAFNLHSGQTDYLSYFDKNNDGTIDILEFGQFSIRIFTPLP